MTTANWHLLTKTEQDNFGNRGRKGQGGMSGKLRLLDERAPKQQTAPIQRLEIEHDQQGRP